MAAESRFDGIVRIDSKELRALNKKLRKVEPELAAAMKKEWRGVAELWASRARSRIRQPYVYGHGSSQKMARRSKSWRPGQRSAAYKGHNMRAAKGIVAGASVSGPFVNYKRKTIPYLPWLDFGGTLETHKRRLNTQTRKRLQRGRYLYPARFQTIPDMVSKAEEVARRYTAEWERRKPTE